jgi:membrane carboxypeptidase/penicillin-binding protein PbpC
MSGGERTIVGGRSRSDRIVRDIPRGIEILLKKAKADAAFRELLLRDPLQAARSIELELGESEAKMLTCAPRAHLRAMVDHTSIPRQQVAVFRTAKTAAALVLALASTLVAPAFASAGMESYPAANSEQNNLARQRMAAVQAALEQFRKDRGRYPLTSEWLEMPELVARYFSPADLYDPWKRKLHYQGIKEQGRVAGYKLESLGLNEQSYGDNIPCPIDATKHWFSSSWPLWIEYPQAGSRIAVAAAPEKSGASIQLRAEHENRNVVVTWYLDGARVGATLRTHVLKVAVGFGEHVLLVADENENRAELRFSLYWKE